MHDRTANLLGAAALAVSDRALAGATAAGLSTSSAAALVVLVHAQADLSVTELGRRVGLTQSAAARMVDSLEQASLVTRARRSARLVHVRLTRRGRRTARDVLAARGAPLTAVVAALDEDEREQLAGLLCKLLTRLHAGNAELMCRLCDREACVTGAPCPVGQAARTGGR